MYIEVPVVIAVYLILLLIIIYIYIRRKRKEEEFNLYQIHFLHIMLIEDNRWLANNSIANELTNRYLKMILPGWSKVVHEEISRFRNRIGLDPIL